MTTPMHHLPAHFETPTDWSPMRPARISRRQAEASFDQTPGDDEVFAVQEGSLMSVELEAVAMESEQEIDRLIEEVDRELAAEELAESARLRMDARDARRPSRSRRRAGRAAVRKLPGDLLTRNTLIGGACGQGKTSGARIVLPHPAKSEAA